MSDEQKMGEQLSFIPKNEAKASSFIARAEVYRVISDAVGSKKEDLLGKCGGQKIKKGSDLVVVEEERKECIISIYHLVEDLGYFPQHDGMLEIKAAAYGKNILPPVKITTFGGVPSETKVEFLSGKKSKSYSIIRFDYELTKLVTLSNEEVKQLKKVLKPFHA